MMRHKWDAAGIAARTERTLLRVRVQEGWLHNIRTDPKRNQRVNAQECVVCYYTTRICGQGFTRYNCADCGVEHNHGNTCVPLLCTSCAKKRAACERCGGNIYLTPEQLCCDVVQICTRPSPHVCTVNGPCNGWPKTPENTGA
jgi:hypothetical protein